MLAVASPALTQEAAVLVLLELFGRV